MKVKMLLKAKSRQKINLQSVQQNGQVLLFVILTMTVALALGIGVSLDTLTSISNIVTGDSAQRALAAAEGGAEHVLSFDTEALDALSDPAVPEKERCEGAGLTYTTDNECIILFAATDLDKVDSKAAITVERFIYTEPAAKKYEFAIEQNQTKEVNLEGFGKNTIGICWNGDVDLYYSVYNANGDTYKNIVECALSLSGDCNPGWVKANALSSTPGYGYASCTPISRSKMVDDPLGVRIRTLGGGGKVAIILDEDVDADLPYQGYKIVSVGSLLNESENVTKSVTVFRSFDYMPSVFDFAIYSTGQITGQLSSE